MKELIYRKLQLTYYSIKIIFLGVIKACLTKISWNEFFTNIETQKINNRLKFWKTIYLNFRTMPSKHAWKTPIWIYGKIKFYDLSGQILPLQDTIIKSGMFIIGHMDQVRSCDTTTSLTINGTIYYGKNVVLRQGAKLRIEGKLVLEDNVYIGDNNTFIISQSCHIKEKTRIAYNCLFMDTDIHYMININDKSIHKNKKNIEIGIGNWIGGYTMIKKGVRTPNFMIVAGPYACLTKDYTKDFTEYTCIGGCPARLIKTGLRRINNPISEQLLNTYFTSNNAPYYYQGNIETFCSPEI